ncbi:MAG: hypothetical protein ABI627_01805 [Polyangiaceae bacterium]
MKVTNQSPNNQAPFWPGVMLIAVGVPVLFWLRCGRVDGFAIGLTAFLLLIVFGVQFIPALNNKYGAEQRRLEVRPGRFDWLGAVWLLAIPFAPFLTWMIASISTITPENWKLILGIKTGLCVVLPCVCVLPLIKYVRGKATPYALLILFIGTAYPVSVGWHAMRDFIRGPIQQDVSVVQVDEIHMMHMFHDIPTGILELKLTDGRTLEANAKRVAIEPGPATLTVLEHSQVVLAVK